MKIRSGIHKENIKKRKQEFARWLEERGRPDGTGYEQKTVRNYSGQVEKSIQREFSLDIEGDEGLFGITDPDRLSQIEKELRKGKDSKRRKDLRSAFQSYKRFVKQETEFDHPEEIPEEYSSRTEGGKKVFLSRKAERDIVLRNQAITIHGTSCKACDFDFGKTYGEWGAGFIEVHHLIPLGGKKSIRRKTDPAKDLTVLCSNCHRMVHRKKHTVVTLKELKQKIQAAGMS